MHDVFICHSSKDRTLAFAACAKLEEAGVRCWIAPRDPNAGMPYGQQIVSAINLSRIVLLIFSGHSNESKAVLNEIELASNREKLILPFRIEEVSPSEGLEFYIRSVHWLDALTPPIEAKLSELTALVKRLLVSMEKVNPGLETVAAAQAVPENPATSVPPEAAKAPEAPIWNETGAQSSETLEKPRRGTIVAALIATLVLFAFAAWRIVAGEHGSSAPAVATRITPASVAPKQTTAPASHAAMRKPSQKSVVATHHRAVTKTPRPHVAVVAPATPPPAIIRASPKPPKLKVAASPAPVIADHSWQSDEEPAVGIASPGGQLLTENLKITYKVASCTQVGATANAVIDISNVYVMPAFFDIGVSKGLAYADSDFTWLPRVHITAKSTLPVTARLPVTCTRLHNELMTARNLRFGHDSGPFFPT